MTIAFYVLLVFYILSAILAFRLYKVVLCWGNMGVKGFRYCVAETKYGKIRGFTHYNTYSQKVRGNLDWFIQIYDEVKLNETTILFSEIKSIKFYPYSLRGFIGGCFNVQL